MMIVLTTPSVWLAVFISIISNIATSCIIEPVKLLGYEKLGMTATLLGAVATARSFITFMTGIPYGNIIDRAKHPVFIITMSNILMGLVYLGYAWCNNVPLYIVLRMLQGACFAMYNISMMIVMAKCVDKSAIGSAIGVLTLFPRIAGSITNRISLYINSLFGITYLAYIASVLAVIAGLLCLLIKFKENEEVGAYVIKKKRQPIYTKALPMVLIFALLQFPSLVAENQIVLYGSSVDMSSAAAVYSSNNTLFMGIAAFIFGFLSDAMSRKQAKYTGATIMLLAGIAGIMVSISQNSNVWLISGIICGICAGGSGIFRNISLREMPASVRAVSIGTFNTSMSMVVSITSAISGFVSDKWGFSSTFFIASMMPFAGAVLTLLFYERFLSYMSDDARVPSETN